MPQEINALIEKILTRFGISHFGYAKLEKPLTFDFYKEWLAENLHAEMEYLKLHAELKENPQLLSPQAQSAISIAVPYFPHPAPLPIAPLKQSRISLYAQGEDYHHWLKKLLQDICIELKNAYPQHEFLAFTDSSPVLERDLARKSGLGWVGKNTCLIHPKRGSLFFLGEIYTSLIITSNHPSLPDFCGKCTKCIDKCPTQALISPRKMDASKCISYLTIESRTPPPEELREKIGDWFFGCDICQTVCPWNQKIYGSLLATENLQTLNESEKKTLNDDLIYILASSGKKLTKDFKGTPLARAGSFGLKRNALIVIGNRRIVELREEVIKLLTHEKLGDLAAWTIKKLDSNP